MLGMSLTISAELSLPIEAVTQTFAILAKRGTGKTHAASVMAEEMLARGQPVVVYDPTGAWYGLKSSKSGKRAGYPVVVFGGEHADVPLEESAGTMIASVIVEKRFPAILDCGLMRKNARIRFMTDFCETLYLKNREALHFFVDEAQTVAPQNLQKMPEAARLLGAMEDIVLMGRRRGLGLTIISPRPAVLNTNLRSACEVIVAMQIIAPHDRKAINEWIDAHGDDETRAKVMMDSLSSLERGEAIVWSPSWLKVFRKIKFRDRRTFDSSATPAVGERVVGPQRVAEIDLDAIGEQIKATVQKAKDDDPRELRRQIVDLRRQLEQRPKAVEQVEVEKVVEVPVLKNGQLGRTEKILARVESQITKLTTEAVELRQSILSAVSRPLPRLTTAHRNVAHQIPSTTAVPTRKPRESATNVDGVRLNRLAERRVLQVLVQHGPRTKRQLAIQAGYAMNGGGFNGALSKLRSAGLIDVSGTGIMATPEGAAAIGDVEPLPVGSGLVDYWMQQFNRRAEREVLRVIVNAYPHSVKLENIANACDPPYEPTGGGFLAAVGKLRTLGLIDGRGELRASEELYD